MEQDLNDIYIKHMRHHGCGIAMFQPVAFADMKPPCCGYFDHNGKWNLIARLSTSSQEPTLAHRLKPLKREPARMSRIGLKWQPKCSRGVRMWNVDISGKSPDAGIPVGADAHVKYQSKARFGAVLIARNPVTVTAINEEHLFKDWVEANKGYLYSLFGRELKRYGMWVVTVTFTATECSINAWLDKDKEALLSAKAKASMVGDYGAELDWTDHIFDKDWSHYSADPARWNRKNSSEAASRTANLAADNVVPKSMQQRSSISPMNDSRASDKRIEKSSPSSIEMAGSPNTDNRPRRSIPRKAALSPIAGETRSIHGRKIGDANVQSQALDSPTPRTRSDARSESKRPQHQLRDLGVSKSPADSSANEGIVLFFDGLRIDQMRWWVEGVKDIASLALSPMLARAEQTIPPVGRAEVFHEMSLQPPNRRLPRQTLNGTKGVYNRPEHLLNRKGDDFGMYHDEYDPEKDEGVLPSQWPRKSRSLLSGHDSFQSSEDEDVVPSNEASGVMNGAPAYREIKRQSHHMRPISYHGQTLYSG